MNILVLNAGSSSLKSHLYQLDGDRLPAHPPEPAWQAEIDWTVAHDHGVLSAGTGNHRISMNLRRNDRQGDWAIRRLLSTLTEGQTGVLNALEEIDVVGHRVVHGGDLYEPTSITPEVKQIIARLVPLAPAHNPAQLAGIEAIESILDSVPQVAVFDTAFHRQMPEEAQRYPIPDEWFAMGIRRYGFHGISHAYCTDRAAQLMERPPESLKLITLHLGHGCSLAAVAGGRCVDTTMGFTPLEGIMMGSRSGSIDPGIVFHLQREEGLDVDQIDRVLNRESGLLGVSGRSSDMRTIEAEAQRGDPRALLALRMFVHRLRAGMGAMLASLAGLDALVFTAGIGEHSARIREESCAPFAYLGLRLDPRRNETAQADQSIAAPDSTVEILVVRTREEWAIARECWLVKQSAPA